MLYNTFLLYNTSVSLALLFLIKLRCGASVNTINYFKAYYIEIRYYVPSTAK